MYTWPYNGQYWGGGYYRRPTLRYGRQWHHGLGSYNRLPYGGYPLWQNAPVESSKTESAKVTAEATATNTALTKCLTGAVNNAGCPATNFQYMSQCQQPNKACQDACDCVTEAAKNIKDTQKRNDYVQSKVGILKSNVGCDCYTGRLLPGATEAQKKAETDAAKTKAAQSVASKKATPFDRYASQAMVALQKCATEQKIFEQGGCPSSDSGDREKCTKPKALCDAACACINDAVSGLPTDYQAAVFSQMSRTGMKEIKCPTCLRKKAQTYVPTEGTQSSAVADGKDVGLGPLDLSGDDGTQPSKPAETAKSSTKPAETKPVVVVPVVEPIVMMGFTKEGLLFASSLTLGAFLLGAFATHALLS